MTEEREHYATPIDELNVRFKALSRAVEIGMDGLNDRLNHLEAQYEPKSDELFKALAQAQLEIQNAEKDTANDFLNSKYASLAAVMAVCREPLAKNGLAIMQLPRLTQSPGVVETICGCMAHWYFAPGTWSAAAVRRSASRCGRAR